MGSCSTIRKLWRFSSIQDGHELEDGEGAAYFQFRDVAIGFVPFSPLGKGFLTGRFDKHSKFGSSDFRNVVPRFKPENLDANQVLVDLIKTVAAEKNATPAQIALAWLLAQKPWSVPIPGTRKLERLVENLGAVDIELTDEELRDINSALSKIAIAGDHYPEELEKRTGR